MKTKLRKKGINSALIFPPFFAQQSEAQSRPRPEKQAADKSEIERPRLNRMLHKSKEQLKSAQSRSLSLKARSVSKAAPFLSKQKSVLRAKPKKGLERTRGSKSTMQISKIYYEGMERYLQQQCEQVLRQEVIASVLSPFKVQSLHPNLLFIKRKPSNDCFPSYAEQPTIKLEKKRSVFSATSLKKVPSRIMEQESWSMLQEVVESKESYEQASQSNTENESSRLRMGQGRMTVLTAAPGQFNSQMLNRLEQTAIYFFSSKFSIRFPTFFRIIRVKILQSQSKTYSLSFTAEFYGQLVHKTISYNPSRAHRRKGEDRKRGNLKKLQLAKDRTKERLLSQLMQEYNEAVFLQFHDMLLLYFEQYLHLERSFRGLQLVDFEECGFGLNGEEKQLWEPGEERKRFYFMLKLSYTFYLIRVVVQETDLLFVFLYDFTTHSVGDHLNFSRPVSCEFKAVSYEFQTVQLFLTAVGEFQAKCRSELVGERSGFKQKQERESNARIGKITSPPLQRWGGASVDRQWDINKDYHLMGELTNFFRFHKHFDYGYFNSVHSENRVDQYIYCLQELARLQVYRYPHRYSIFKLTQIEQQALLIPHLAGQLTPSHSKNCVRQFFRHKQRVNKKQIRGQWSMHLGKDQVRCQARQDQLEVFMQSSVTLRCNKVTIPFERMGIHYQNRPDLQDLSLELEKTLKTYRLVPRFIYSRPTRSLQPHLEIYQKRLEKFDGHYAYVTLYGLPLHGLVEFKLLMFKLSREFVIRVDRDDDEQPNYGKLSLQLVALMKNRYFRKLLQGEAEKIKQRRVLLLEDFYKHHGKNYAVKSRKQINSQKNQFKRRTKRKDTVVMTTEVYENIVSEVYRPQGGPEYYISIRYCPATQLRERGQWKDEGVEICVHRQERVSYFKCVVAMADLVHSVSQGRLTLQHLDYRKAHDFFREVFGKIKVILATTSHSRFNLAVDRLRNFVRSSQRPSEGEVHPFRFRLAATALIEGKELVNTSLVQPSQMSIEFELDKQSSFIAPSVRRNSFSPVFGSDQVQKSVTHFSFNCSRNFEQSYMRSVGEDYYIEARSIFGKGDNLKLLRQYKFIERQIWIVERNQGSKRLLGEWQADFVGDILLKQSNRRMFRRLVKAATVFL